ncbi:MAG TPA: RdgB/HAM1 family non-canonical purine NTP pyrophosphatase [Candidatus Acidoferrum sp.]|jgi:XTP/dITP diphosphohydrolase|nr:RdgB/HAM1 family non-canonical purine NTP pyrophosphatase [Candidatus Acidoferrum sp.]
MRPRILLASSNAGKLNEYRELAAGAALDIALLPDFEKIPEFDEFAPTFAENSAGKALHYSRYSDEIVLADDSGLVVPALDGAPGVRSARYAGPNASAADCVARLLRKMSGTMGNERRARFVCVISIARQGRAVAIVSDKAEGFIATEPRGTNGFGYDPVFLFPGGRRTYAEVTSHEKNAASHRGRAFQRLLDVLTP